MKSKRTIGLNPMAENCAPQVEFHIHMDRFNELFMVI